MVDDIYKVDTSKDTSIYLFDYKFQVRVRKMEYTSVGYLRTFGDIVTGNEEIDRELQNEWLDYYFSIDQMVESYKKGVNIKVVKYADTKIIYDFITAHLNAWKFRMETAINIGTAPLEDLIVLDEFASKVYPYAVSQFTPETVTSVLAERLASLVGFSKQNLFNRNVIPTKSLDSDLVKINSDDGELYPKRESMADLFTTRSFSVNRNW